MGSATKELEEKNAFCLRQAKWARGLRNVVKLGLGVAIVGVVIIINPLPETGVWVKILGKIMAGIGLYSILIIPVMRLVIHLVTQQVWRIKDATEQENGVVRYVRREEGETSRRSLQVITVPMKTNLWAEQQTKNVGLVAS